MQVGLARHSPSWLQHAQGVSHLSACCSHLLQAVWVSSAAPTWLVPLLAVLEASARAVAACPKITRDTFAEDGGTKDVMLECKSQLGRQRGQHFCC